MPKLSFPLVKSSPTDSEYAEICTSGGSRPPCQLKVMAYSGAATPSDTYGNLTVVNLPIKSETSDCETLIEVFMQTGCPAGTTDMTWDDTYSDDTVDRSGSANIGVSDGYGPFLWEIIGGYGFTLENAETTEHINTLYASSTACGIARIQVTDMCQTEITGEVTCEQLPLVSWDYDVSEETIDRGESAVLIAVKDGTGPFTWVVTPSDFNVGQIETSGRQNTLNANWVACGSAIITVEDACGTICEGYVRCTTGQWVEIEDVASAQHACGSDFLNPGTGSSTGTFTETLGKFRVSEQVGVTNCGHVSSTSCQTYQSGSCIGLPYTTYGTSALQYHYPCICDVNLSVFPIPWADCSPLSNWPCCHNASSNRINSPYWGRSKYEWTC